MSEIFAWAIDTWLGRIVSAALFGFAFLKGWLFFHHDPKVRSQAYTKVERATTNAANNAVAKQSAIPSDGASRRLQREYCPDCK